MLYLIQLVINLKSLLESPGPRLRHKAQPLNSIPALISSNHRPKDSLPHRSKAMVFPRKNGKEKDGQLRRKTLTDKKAGAQT